MKNLIKNLFGMLIFLILISISVNAVGFGVTQPGAVVIAPGESKIVDFLIQTGAGDKEDVTATLEIVRGKEIIELIENNEYLVPASGETKASIKINMPKDAKPDDKWKIELSFKAKPITQTKEEKMVGLGYGVNINFDVMVSEPEKVSNLPTGEAVREIKTYNNLIIAIVVILVIGIVAYFLWKKKKPISKKK